MNRDYIKREDAVKALHTIKSCIKLLEDSVEETAVAVDTYAQAADVEEVRHGRWIEDGYYNEPCVCSFCGEPCKDAVMGRPMWNYCPNCGAKMDGGVNDA